MSNKKIVVAAPMSYTGSLGRTQNAFWFDKPLWFKLLIGIWAVPIIVFSWWVLIFVWYAVFGIFLVPYRLIRRGSRKRRIEQRRHQEILEAMKQLGD